MNGLQLYFRLVQISLLSQMQYRANFIVGLLGLIVWNVVNLALIGILITQFTSLRDWALWELVFLYCLWILGYSLYGLFFSHTGDMENYLIEGTFDQFLLRPASPLIQVLGREFQYLEIADALFALTGLSLAYTRLGLQWDAWHWGFFVLAVVSGALIALAINLLISCTAFWTGRSRGAAMVVGQFSGLVHWYPIDIFGRAFRVIVTGLLPVAFLNYYPALVLLGKLDQDSAGWWLSYMSPLVALLLIGIVSRVWSLALKQYTSAGS
ncbi:MAG TPA: ABC-2 family transporter protein [Anaerolineales bacterium]|nr:ABC-2 family transporter protein [Anaerolineales bacterium]